MSKPRGARGKKRKEQRKIACYTPPDMQPDYYIPPSLNGYPLKDTKEKKDNA